ncbi:MAG: hypothetical protein ABSG37_03925 [Candidatus Limnocylindrales bacterium]|jgi:hypothetical protein
MINQEHLEVFNARNTDDAVAQATASLPPGTTATATVRVVAPWPGTGDPWTVDLLTRTEGPYETPRADDGWRTPEP